MKRQLTSKYLRKICNADEAFSNEIKAYSTIVPLLNSISRVQPLPYPTCLFSGHDRSECEVIVLEDLKDSGYFTADRLTPLNFEQCNLVLRNFAQLHATSMVLRIVDRKKFDRALECINDYFFTEDKVNSLSAFLEEMVSQCLKDMKGNNIDGLLSGPITFLENCTKGKLFRIAQNIVLRERDENLMTICHGDSWFNNFMFKEDKDGSVVDVKFVDLQIMRYTSPTIDLLHFFYSSTDTTLRNQYYDQLMVNYQEALIESIDEMTNPHLDEDGVGERISHLKSLYTVDLVKERMERNSLYGLAQFLLLLPIFTYPESKLLKPEVGDEPQEFTRRLRQTVLEFQDRGWLNEEYLD